MGRVSDILLDLLAQVVQWLLSPPWNSFFSWLPGCQLSCSCHLSHSVFIGSSASPHLFMLCFFSGYTHSFVSNATYMWTIPKLVPASLLPLDTYHEGIFFYTGSGTRIPSTWTHLSHNGDWKSMSELPVCDKSRALSQLLNLSQVSSQGGDWPWAQGR